jgi:hypothetical protein
MISKTKKGIRVRKAILLYFLAGLAIAVLFSCTGKRAYIIPEKKFIPVLVNIHLADGIAMVVPYSSSTLKLDSTELYQSVFSKHHITRVMFDSSMAYYLQRPEKLKDMYSEVNSILSKMESDLESGKGEPEAEKKIIVWQENKTYVLPQMGSINKVEISMPASKPGTYTLSARIRLFEDDRTVAPRITLFFWFDNGTPKGYREYFPSVPLTRDGKTNTYTVSGNLVNPVITNIKGYLIDHSNADTLFAKHAIVSDIKVYFHELKN